MLIGRKNERMAGLTGLEPITFDSTGRRTSLLCYNPTMVPRGGLEPPTFCLSDRCANQLRHLGVLSLKELMVPLEGFEPPRPYGHRYLKPAHLPITPQRHALAVYSTASSLSNVYLQIFVAEIFFVTFSCARGAFSISATVFAASTRTAWKTPSLP